MLPHLPALRRGKPYASLDQVEIKDCRSGEPLARSSQVNAGVIRKDLGRLGETRASLKKLSCAELVAACQKAAALFLESTLPLGDQGHTQSPDEYVQTLSRTSGLPWGLVRKNMQRIAAALTHMPAILSGLTRGLDLQVLDRGWGEQAGSRLSYYPAAQALGLVMPSNSPSVNSLWLPAVALRVPIILKPGRDEPWTPCRLIQALIAAGCPAEMFGFYPTDHEGAGEILRSCGRALVFGDKNTTAQYANNPGIQVHGPGFSKLLIGEDQIERWPDFLDVMVESIAANGGRSCINASTVVVPKYAAEIAEALARRLGPVAPLPPEDQNAQLAAFANPAMAEGIEATIEEGLGAPGATDVTARHRNGSRKAALDGGVYLRPTIVLCDSFAHPLANREFLFPFASVVQVPQAEALRQIGPSLAVTAITEDPGFRETLLSCPLIDRLNLGPIPTMRISWDQPHEGNLFEFLYRRRAIELS